MKLRLLRMATFTNATLATLQDAVNDFLQGLAVAAATSGTVDYAAGDVGERTLVDQQFYSDGTTFTVAVFYTE